MRTRSSLSTRAAASKEKRNDRNYKNITHAADGVYRDRRSWGNIYTKKYKKMPFWQRMPRKRMPRKQAADGECDISVIYKYD